MANRGLNKIRCKFCNNRFKRQGMHKHVEFCAVRLSQQQPASAGRIAVHAKPAVYKRSPARSVSAQSLKDRLIGLREAIESIEASIDHAVKML